MACTKEDVSPSLTFDYQSEFHCSKTAKSFVAYMREGTEGVDPKFVQLITAQQKTIEHSGSSGVSLALGISGELAKKHIKLPKEEYAKVMRAINTNYHFQSQGKLGEMSYITKDDKYYAQFRLRVMFFREVLK